MRDEYDVVVVGAGPAGAYAAATAASECDVLLIEKRQEIGDPVRCAEGVSKGALSKFLRPQKEWIANKVSGARIFAPDGTILEVSEELAGPEVGYVLERKIFDRDLAKRAAKAGADVTVRTRAVGVIREDGFVRGVKVRHLGEPLEIRASVVIAADGVESQVARWAGINTTLRPSDLESCAQYLMTNADIKEDYCDFYLGSESPGGYAWAFPKGPQEGNIGMGVLASKLAGKFSIDYLNAFVERHFPDAQPVELHLGGVPVSKPARKTVADGLMLVGDAARHVDPITGGGIINALEGGRLAGDVAVQAVRAQDPSLKVLKHYEVGWRASFGKKLERNYKIKDIFVNLSDAELNKLIRSIEGLSLEEMSVAGIVKRLISSNPRLLVGLRHLF
ncbi:MAG: NAD(P)/FAD-dependent oxidoreductase [Halobacteriota archaeon]